MITKITLPADNLKTIIWAGDAIVDHVSASEQYFLNGDIKQAYHFSLLFSFDSAVSSADGEYVFVYEKLGTKGLLMKNGVEIREINRSYYCANHYEYPATFATIKGTTYLIHCPKEYCRLDFENVETGKIVTQIKKRKPSDIFHSRLEVSPDGKFLIVKGWIWHPVDFVNIYNLEDCLNNPLLLDNHNLFPNDGFEVNTVSFINSNRILIGTPESFVFNGEGSNSLPPKHIAIWNFETDELSPPVKVNGEFGNLFAIDENFAWDMYKYPKIINIRTGEIVDKDESIDSGEQNSSILNQADKFPQIAFNRQNKMMAIGFKDKIEVLEWKGQ